MKVHTVVSQADGSNFISVEKVFTDEEAAHRFARKCAKDDIYRNFWVANAVEFSNEDNSKQDDRVL